MPLEGIASLLAAPFGRISADFDSTDVWVEFSCQSVAHAHDSLVEWVDWRTRDESPRLFSEPHGPGRMRCQHRPDHLKVAWGRSDLRT
jgi:hypothetical protein